jgi:hypothetical protein
MWPQDDYEATSAVTPQASPGSLPETPPPNKALPYYQLLTTSVCGVLKTSWSFSIQVILKGLRIF